MTPQELNELYEEKKYDFHAYIESIKKKSNWDLNTIINPTLVKNPYASSFPQNYFLNISKNRSKFILFIINVIKFYLRNIYLFFSYIVAFILYKLYYKKKRSNSLENIIDVFGLTNVTNKNEKFCEDFLSGLYKVFDKYNFNYTLLIRPYQVDKNPFKLKNFFKIINNDRRDFIFEYELLTVNDFIKLFAMILIYPFHALRLLQKEKKKDDRIFNQSLIDDFKWFSFVSLTRYILGQKLSKISSIKKIYSWSEFQVIERSFNYAIRKNCNHIQIIGLQFYINYKTYFNAYPEHIDYLMLSSPHKILVNGKFFVMDKKNIIYNTGVSLRYKNLFNFKQINPKNVLLIGSYVVSDTKHMLKCVKNFKNIIFKNHPAVDLKTFGRLSKNITICNENIYNLFQNTKLVIVTASGTGVEAVTCGISVIIVASQDNFTANPLVEKGKGKVWDIAFNKKEIDIIYKKLVNYRIHNQTEIKKIANWYKNNFFIEPTEKNIVKVFGIEEEK